MRTSRSHPLRLLALEDRTTPAGTQIVAVGADAGAAPEVRVFRTDGTQIADFLAFDQSFTGGVRVAVGDVNGDNIDDVVVGAGPGGGSQVRVFDGAALQNAGQAVTLAQFQAFETSFTGGVYVATSRLLVSAGRFQIVVGAGEGGGPRVSVLTLNGTPPTPIAGPLGNFYAYDPQFTGGVRVAAGNLDGLLGDELVTAAGPGGGPHIKVFRNDGSLLASFYAYDPSFTGGVYVAAADVDGIDSNAELITGAGAGGGPNVKVFDVTNSGVTLRNSFYAYDPAFTGGVRVGAGFQAANLPPLGGIHPEVVTGPGPAGGPDVRAFDATAPDRATPTAPLPVTPTADFLAFASSFAGGILVGV